MLLLPFPLGTGTGTEVESRNSSGLNLKVRHYHEGTGVWSVLKYWLNACGKVFGRQSASNQEHTPRLPIRLHAIAHDGRRTPLIASVDPNNWTVGDIASWMKSKGVEDDICHNFTGASPGSYTGPERRISSKCGHNAIISASSVFLSAIPIHSNQGALSATFSTAGNLASQWGIN
jgi:hypothetical protein